MSKFPSRATALAIAGPTLRAVAFALASSVVGACGGSAAYEPTLASSSEMTPVDGPIHAAVLVRSSEGLDLVAIRDFSGHMQRLASGVDAPMVEDLVHRGDLPYVYPNGRAVVYFSAGVPWRFDALTGGRERLLPDGPLEREGFFTAGSPDGSKALLFRFSAFSLDDDGIFYEGSFEVRARGSVTPFVGLTDQDEPVQVTDAGEVLALHLHAGENAKLQRIEASGTRTTLLEADAGDTLGQFAASSGGAVAWSGNGTLWSARLVEGRLVDRHVAVVRGASAEYQWPSMSPSSDLLVYTHEVRTDGMGDPTSVRIEAVRATGGDSTLVYTCSAGCRATFVTGDDLLVEDAGGLTHVRVDGRSRRLLEEAVAVVVRGR